MVATPTLLRHLAVDAPHGMLEIHLDALEGPDVSLRFEGVSSLRLGSPGWLDGLVREVRFLTHPERQNFSLEIEIESMGADGLWAETILFVEARSVRQV
ncbi:MAG: hypothetical protein ACKVPX_07140 [Myxococcaceae bacterium]